MRFHKQRVLFECINFVLSLLFIFPVSLFFERFLFPSSPFMVLTATSCLSVIGYILGRVSMNKAGEVSIVLCFAGAIVIAAVIMFTAPAGYLFYKIIYALIAAAMTVLFFFMARKAGYVIYAPFSIVGIIIYLLCMILYKATELSSAASNLTNWCAIIYFLLSLYALNAKGLRKSLHKGSDDKSVRYPAGMQMNNFLLITGFIILAAIVSNIYPLFKLFQIASVYFVKGFGGVFAFINKLLDQRTGNNTHVEDDTATEVGQSIFDDMPEHEISTLEDIIFYGVVFLCLLIILIVFLRWLFKTSKKNLKKLPKFMNKFRSMFDPEGDSEFIDETEDLFDLKSVLSNLGMSIKETAKKLTQRPEKIEDMPNNRMKVRFAYKELLKKGQTKYPSVVCETPIEFYEKELKAQPELIDFILYYNYARYSQDEIPDKAVEIAKDAMKVKIQ